MEHGVDIKRGDDVNGLKRLIGILNPRKIFPSMEDYIKIVVLENEIEASVLDSILTERDIPHLMRSYHDTAYDGLFQTQKGWGYVGAPESFKEEIIEILNDLRKDANRLDDSDAYPSGK